MQAKVLCTTSRAKKIVVGLTVVAMTAEAINLASLYLARTDVINHIYALVFRMLVPATVLVMNLMVVREVRRRTSNAAANNLGVQHHQSTLSNSAVPTIMLITTSFVYVLLCSMASVLYVVHQWVLKATFSHEHILSQCWMIAAALSLLVHAYNFYVYLIIGRQFRSELHKLFCSCCSSSATNEAIVSRNGQTVTAV